MEISTETIWFVVPVFLSIILSVFLQNRKWFSTWAMFGFGISCGFFGALFAPAVLCENLSGKHLGSIGFALAVNIVLMYSFTGYLRYTYTKPN